MIEFINSITGGKMLVAEDRVEEYIAAGHKPAALPSSDESAEQDKPAKSKKRTAKK